MDKQEYIAFSGGLKIHREEGAGSVIVELDSSEDRVAIPPGEKLCLSTKPDTFNGSVKIVIEEDGSYRVQLPPGKVKISPEQ